ncbi:MAG: right-handed parallel beta-helix repeat-containing protein [Verrucomicrobiota bacterium]
MTHSTDQNPTEPIPAVAAKRNGRMASYLTWFVVIFAIAAGGGYLLLKLRADQRGREHEQITRLNKIGAVFIQNRRWHEAGEVYSEIAKIDPRSQVALAGRRKIETAIEEEQNQFIGYWTGQAIAELEAGRLKEAAAAIAKLTGDPRYASQPEAVAIAGKIAQARSHETRNETLSQARTAFEQRQWKQAHDKVQELLRDVPSDPEATSLLGEIEATLAKTKADRSRSAQLLADARTRDHGVFDEQAADWLREAIALDPDNSAARELLEKFSSYTRTIRVPGDFATPTEALARAHGRDRIVLGELNWTGTLVVNSPLVIEGAGPAKTTITCEPNSGAAISFGPQAKGARVSGISFTHAAMVSEPGERFPAALVRGGEVVFTDCVFRDSAGHGLAVVEGGTAVAGNCRFQGNAWNGATAIGTGARLEVRDSDSNGNFSNGFEIWAGASGLFTNNRCERNSRNGIHTAADSAEVVITGNHLSGNREFGIVLSGGTKGAVAKNQATGNLLGGIVIRATAAAISVTENVSSKNLGPGLILEKGLAADAYSLNTTDKNVPRDILANAPLGE